MRYDALRTYVEKELQIDLEAGKKDGVAELLVKLEAKLRELSPARLEQVAATVAAPPAVLLPDDYDGGSDGAKRRELKTVDGYDLRGHCRAGPAERLEAQRH